MQEGQRISFRQACLLWIGGAAALTLLLSLPSSLEDILPRFPEKQPLEKQVHIVDVTQLSEATLMLPLNLEKTPVVDLREDQLRQLHAFKSDLTEGQNYELGTLYECIQQVHSESVHADRLVLWSNVGTILAIQRGWQPPWDWDMDLAYEAHSPVIDAMIEIWTPWSKKPRTARIHALSYQKCKHLRNDITVEVVKEGQLRGLDKNKKVGQIQRICTGKACVDFWEYEAKGDMLCNWVCLKRSEIFPIGSRTVNFFRPSAAGVELYAIKVPSIADTEAFMKAYHPYRTWREVPYNLYNKTSEQWTFSHDLRRKYLLGLGPQISLRSIEGKISRIDKQKGM